MSEQALEFPLQKRRVKPHIEKAGSVAVRVYKTTWRCKKLRRTYRTHVVVYRDSQGEHREKHADLAVAKQRANEIANGIANGQIALQTVTPADWACYRRSLEIIAPTGKPLETIAADHVQFLARLEGRATPDQVAEFWLLHNPAGASKKTIPDILLEMVEARKRDGASQNTLDDFDSRLGKFAKAFTGPILSVTAPDLNAWLRKLPVSNRTRNNYRGNLVDFFRFAKQAGYIPKTWSMMDDVPRVKNEPVKIQVFTPEEITKILSARENIESRRARTGKPLRSLIPYIAIAAFAGPRHEELSAGVGPDGKPLPVLDWRQVDFDKKEIHILPEVARKIGHDRIVPMSENLIAWLAPHRRPNGPICEIANTTGALARAAAAVKVKWKDNGLRRSFISYRLAQLKNIGTVALEAGTSPDRIRHNYKKTVPDREADRWFDIWPTNADIIQLPLAL